jgi:hypothetical protein
LALFGTPAFADPIKAWKYGTTVPALYHTLKGAGKGPISLEDKKVLQYFGPVRRVPVNTRLASSLDWTFKSDGQKSAAQLSREQHHSRFWAFARFGTFPIKDPYNTPPRRHSASIDLDLMKTEFSHRTRQVRAAKLPPPGAALDLTAVLSQIKRRHSIQIHEEPAVRAYLSSHPKLVEILPAFVQDVAQVFPDCALGLECLTFHEEGDTSFSVRVTPGATPIEFSEWWAKNDRLLDRYEDRFKQDETGGYISLSRGFENEAA